MYKRLWQEPYPANVVCKWLLMAFIGGNINAGGFMACRRFVSHATGFYTLFGIDAAALDWRLGLSMLSVPVYFLGGVMLGAYFTDRAIVSGRDARFGLVMGGVALLLVVAACGGYFRLFGIFGTAFHLGDDYPLLIILSIASGLENSVITSASGGALRSTHMTGLTTDLGIGLIRARFGRSRGPLRATETYRNWLRIGIILTFAGGSLVGAMLFSQVQYLGFLLPAILATYVGNLGLRAVLQAPAIPRPLEADDPRTG